MSATTQPKFAAPTASGPVALPAIRRGRSLYVTRADDIASQRLAQREAEEYCLPETRINERDGSVLRLIPAGEFVMGSSPTEIEAAIPLDESGDAFALEHEGPQRRVLMPAFYLGVYAVTNAQFVRFLNDVRPASEQMAHWLPKLERISCPASDATEFFVEAGYERHPVVHVSWPGAHAYCQWAGLRLPREPEWEKGARGVDGRLFPWGDVWCDECVQWPQTALANDMSTAPVDAHPGGRSPYGLFQMSGNVEEWCADPYQMDAYQEYARGVITPPSSGHRLVVRGGSCLSGHKLEFRCTMRRASAAGAVVRACVGFRCACGELRWTRVRSLAPSPKENPPPELAAFPVDSSGPNQPEITLL